jgi:cytochrome c peroxidase
MLFTRVMLPSAMLLGLLTGAAAAPTSDIPPAIDTSNFTQEQLLGAELFFDKGLSKPAGQACASCHDFRHAFADPDKESPTSGGVHAKLYGFRNAPSAKYTMFVPPLSFAGDDSGYAGGLFWDGRAATLEDQAKQPFLNPFEMANKSVSDVVSRLQARPEAALFLSVYGGNAFSDADNAYDLLAHAIASFERTPLFNPFSSKYDAYLNGKAQLTKRELHGLQLFEDPNRANCASCHLDRPSPDGTPPLFTDFGFDNIGIPKNGQNPFYQDPKAINPAGAAFIDLGLGFTVPPSMQGEHNLATNGKYKASSLRNVAITAPYSHNGYFPTLYSIVHFYNTRDVLPPCADPLTPEPAAESQGCWPAAEITNTMNTVDLGNLGLSKDEENDMVAFLQTLTDGWKGH